jgi:peroxiredoxin
MAQPPICNFGWKAPGFALKGTDGKTHTLKDVRGPKGTLIVFICNHCPYVRSIADRLAEEARALQALGFGVAAIMSNDTKNFNADDELQYRGRLDESKTTLVKNARRDLYEAMKQIAKTGSGPKDQIPSMGCSIKWRS